jgi:subtilase family serine protease
MRSRRISRLIPSLSLLLASFTPFSRAAVQDRIVSVNNGSRASLHGTVSTRVKHSTDLGSAPQNQRLATMSLGFSMTAAQQASLTQLLAAQTTPGSPGYHQWLTPEQVAAQFGLSSGDIAKVSSWLTSQGFTVTSRARTGTFITFSGTVAQAQQAFGTTIHSLSYKGEQNISNVTDPTLPMALSGVVSDIRGLNDFKLKPHSRIHNAATNSASPSYTLPINGTPNHFLSPADFYTIYDVAPLTSAGITGTGITVAVMGQSDINLANIATFRSAAGLPANAPKVVLVPNSADPGISVNDVDEAHIDVEWSGAAAQGATILYVNSTDVFNSLTYAIDNKLATIMTISYGNCESGWGTTSLSNGSQTFQLANAMGITIVAAAGDDGATDCDTAGLATEGLSVDFPGSSPYVVSAGGTMFSGDVNSSASTYWSSTNAANGGSAVGYIPEQPWNETTTAGGLDAGGAGGGGVSSFFSKPAWQTGTGVPDDSSRDVPDISLNAASNHDGYLVCTTGSTDANGNAELPCLTNSFLTSSGQPNVFGGTSFVAPSFAGILALVQQKLGAAASNGLGNVGPVLYGLANVANVYHDITTGDNSIPCVQGTLNCPNANSSIGYNATVGYDQASGLGSIDIANLVNGWSTAVPTSSVGTVGPNSGCNPSSPTPGTASCLTTTALTSSNTNFCAISSGTFPLSVAVAGAISGTLPTGTVQFFVDNALVAGSTVTLSGGAATYTLNTAALASGGHTISAAYSGDANYAGSKGTLLGPTADTVDSPNGPISSVDVVSSTKPDFSITPCTGSTSAAPSAVAPGITFTITPFNGFTGTINLTAANNSGASATPAFTVSPVTITSSAGVTTSFVLSAFTTTTATAANRKPTPKSGRAPWYAAGSGATLACMLLLTLPRRRRWGALLAVLLSVAAITAVGCSNSSTTGTPTNPTNPTNPTTTTPASPTQAGQPYIFTVTAISTTGLVHSATVALTVP